MYLSDNFGTPVLVELLHGAVLRQLAPPPPWSEVPWTTPQMTLDMPVVPVVPMVASVKLGSDCSYRSTVPPMRDVCVVP